MNHKANKMEKKIAPSLMAAALLTLPMVVNAQTENHEASTR